MAAPLRNSASASPASLAAFGFVWTAGILISFISFRLAVSGRFVEAGVPRLADYSDRDGRHLAMDMARAVDAGVSAWEMM